MSHVGEEVAVVDDAGAGPEARRARRETPSRSMSENTDPTVVLESGDNGPTPEEALAAAQKALTEKDRVIEVERSRATTAEATAAQARDQAARDRQGAQIQRQNAVAAAAETAAADKATAIAMKKSARESGDLEMELKADDLLASANYRLNDTARQTEEMKMTDPGKGAGVGPDNQPRQRRISPASQAWIDRQSEWQTDPKFRKEMLALDGQLALDGVLRDSPAYFRELDRAASEYRSAQGDKGGYGHMDNGNGGRRPASSEGAPPSRGNGGHGGASRQVRTPLGTLSVSRRADGKLAIVIPKDARADFEEGAKVTGMQLGEYVHEQVKIADEIAAGGNGGLITEEGSRYR